MNIPIKTAFLILAALSAPAIARESGTYFYHKNWEVACDNTLTCRTLGFERDREMGSSVLLTRQAGMDTVPTGEVMLEKNDLRDDSTVNKLTIWINGKSAGDLTAAENGVWRLSQPQTLALISAVKGNGNVEFKGGESSFTLSNDGAYATMLKVDDVQGRIGTPGAWTKTGDKPESSVAKAISQPVIQAAKVSHAQPRILSKSEVAALRPRLLATLNEDMDCERMTYPGQENINGEIDKDEFTLTPLDDHHALISTLCWSGAYNEGHGYWIIDKQLKGDPVAVTNAGYKYQDGVISSYFMVSSMGNSATEEQWVWEGKAFPKSRSVLWRSRSEDGGWEMPLLVTEVKTAN